jgi:hypothetical protein
VEARLLVAKYLHYLPRPWHAVCRMGLCRRLAQPGWSKGVRELTSYVQN